MNRQRSFARYLHDEVGLTHYDIADKLGVRVEQVTRWLK